MLSRLGDMFFALGALIAALCAVAFVYLTVWGEGVPAQAGQQVTAVLGLGSLLLGAAIRYVLRG